MYRKLLVRQTQQKVRVHSNISKLVHHVSLHSFSIYLQDLKADNKKPQHTNR